MFVLPTKPLIPIALGLAVCACDKELPSLGSDVARLVAQQQAGDVDAALAGRVRRRLGAKPAATLGDLLGDENVAVRVWAAQSLGMLGPACLPGIPALVRTLRHPDRQTADAALAALIQLGPHAIPALIDTLGSGDAALRERASRALLGMGAAAVEPLAAATGNENPAVRLEACAVLASMAQTASIGPGAVQPALPALITALGDRDSGVQTWAAIALGALGATAAPALPGLEALRDDADPNLRDAAARAIEMIK